MLDNAGNQFQRNSESGFRNWVPKVSNYQICGRPLFLVRVQSTQIITINMYLLIEMMYNILIWDYIEVKKLEFNVEIDILRNHSQIILSVLTPEG